MYKIIKNVNKIYFETCNIWAPAWGYIHVKKTHVKNGKKLDIKEIFFKLPTNGRSDKEFLFTSKFCLQGVVCPCPGAICIKSFKICLKSYFEEIVSKLATNGQSDKGCLLTSWGYIHV